MERQDKTLVAVGSKYDISSYNMTVKMASWKTCGFFGFCLGATHVSDSTCNCVFWCWLRCIHVCLCMFYSVFIVYYVLLITGLINDDKNDGSAQ